MEWLKKLIKNFEFPGKSSYKNFYGLWKNEKELEQKKW